MRMENDQWSLSSLQPSFAVVVVVVASSISPFHYHHWWNLREMDRLEGILSELSHLDLAGEIVEKEPHASGLGGSCDVYTAWSRKHEKKVAVKQVRAFLKKDLSLAKRLAREICIWAKLYHENVLPLLGFFTEGDNAMPAFVSEWMERGTLHDFMRTFPRASLDTLLMIRDIAKGLEYLHSEGVIHADLKSPNILISRDSKPLLADFGLSLALSESMAGTSTTGAFTKGTVRWMARELLVPGDSGFTSRPDEQTDVWALGMVIYELISWKSPYWDRPSDILVFMAIVNSELPGIPEDQSDVDLDIFRGLWDTCQSCWAARSNRVTAKQLVERVIDITNDWLCEEAKKIPMGFSRYEGTVWHVMYRGNSRSALHICHAKFDTSGEIAFACNRSIIWGPIVSKEIIKYGTGDRDELKPFSSVFS
ncbi:kinase-like protein [Schizopora paradoxa]|uniref:Kinase-like protein n=1 Tax=Schizopora paradoxa TaxID=27342 RepID=A0A0H2RJ81_9AGAM|nr:kinase-like protein [Schizopora paradoxa]